MRYIRERFHDDGFPPRVVEACSELVDKGMGEDPDKARRTLLRDLAFAIDGEDTKCSDDAISYNESTGMVMVHITDVARVFGNEHVHPAVQEAFDRGTSIFGAVHEEPMFPEEVSEQFISLAGDRHDGSTITTMFKIDDNGDLEEDSFEVSLTRLDLVVRLTYEEADELIADGEQDLQALHAKAKMRGMRRRDVGELKDVIQDEVRVRSSRSGGEGSSWNTTFEKLGRSGAREMIAELMISANYVFSWVMSGFQVPIPYRYQRMFEYVHGDGILDLSPYYQYLAYGNAKAAKQSTYSQEHCGLGLDQYCTMTSPARKSVDLLCQFQVKAAIGGAKSFPPALVEDVMSTHMERSRAVSNFVREQRRALTMAHLGSQVNETMQCVFLRASTWRTNDKIDDGEPCMEAEVVALEYDLKLMVFIRVDRNSEKLQFPCTFPVKVVGVMPGSGKVITKPVKLAGPPQMLVSAETIL